MPSNFNVVRYMGAAEHATLRGGLFLTDINTVPGAVLETVGPTGRRGGSAAKWVSAAGVSLFVVISNQIFESTDDGATWASVYTFVSAQNRDNTGFLHVTGSDNQPYLVCMGEGSSPEIASYDGTTWRTDSSTGGGGGARFPYPAAGAFAGLFWVKRESGFMMSFDPVSRASVQQVLSPNPDVGSVVRQRPAWFSLQKRFFVAIQDEGAVDAVRCYELVLGSWIDTGVVLTYLPDNGTEDLPGLATLEIADNSVLIFGRGRVGGPLANNYGLECGHLQISAGVLTETRVTDTVVPSYLRFVSALGDNDDYDVFGFVDTLTNPGTPERYLFFDPDAGVVSTYSVFQVTDHLTEMVLLGTSQLTNDWSAPKAYHGDGGQLWTPGEVSIQIVDQAPDPNGLLISYRVNTATATPAGDKVARFRFRNALGVPAGVCTLRAGSATGGGTVVGNEVTGITDNGNLQTVVWDFLADGVPDGTYLHDQAEVTRP